MLTSDINRSIGMQGRTGSAFHANAIGENVGNFRNDAMAREIQRQQGLQLGYGGLIAGIGQSGGTRTTEESGGSPFGQALGGALGLAQLGASAGLFGPVGMGVGALTGGMGGAGRPCGHAGLARDFVRWWRRERYRRHCESRGGGNHHADRSKGLGRNE